MHRCTYKLAVPRFDSQSRVNQCRVFSLLLPVNRPTAKQTNVEHIDYIHTYTPYISAAEIQKTDLRRHCRQVMHSLGYLHAHFIWALLFFPKAEPLTPRYLLLYMALSMTTPVTTCSTALGGRLSLRLGILIIWCLLGAADLALRLDDNLSEQDNDIGSSSTAPPGKPPAAVLNARLLQLDSTGDDARLLLLYVKFTSLFVSVKHAVQTVWAASFCSND